MYTHRTAIGLRSCLALSAIAGVAMIASCGSDSDPVPGGNAAGTGGTAGSGGGGGTSSPDGGECQAETVRVLDDITASTTWTACNVYVIPQQKQLFVKGGATLT